MLWYLDRNTRGERLLVRHRLVYSCALVLTLAAACPALTVSEQNDAVVAALGPIHWWKFNNPITPTTAIDEIAGYDNAVRNGPVAMVPGAFGNDSTSVEFWPVRNGQSTLVFNHSNTLLLDEGSLSFWMYDTSAIHTAGVISKDAAGLGNGGHLSIMTQPLTGTGSNTGKLSVRLQSTTDSHYVVSPVMPTQTWHHVVFSFGSEGMKLYLNGDLVDSNAYTGGLLGNLNPMVFGASSAGATSGYNPLRDWWSGMLDQVAFFDTALPPQAVRALYTGNRNDIPEPAAAALLLLTAPALLRRRRGA